MLVRRRGGERKRVLVADLGPGEAIGKAAAPGREEDAEEAEAEREHGQRRARQPSHRAADPDPVRAVVVDELDVEEAHAGRLPGKRPERPEVERPGADPE